MTDANLPEVSEPNDAIDRLGSAINTMCNVNESDLKVREPRAFVDNSSLTKISELEAEAAALRAEVERLKAKEEELRMFITSYCDEIDGWRLEVKNKDAQLTAANARVAELSGAVAVIDEAIEFAVEGWGYASEYFREKWKFDKVLAELKAKHAALADVPGGGGVSDKGKSYEVVYTWPAGWREVRYRRPIEGAFRDWHSLANEVRRLRRQARLSAYKSPYSLRRISNP